ncbi:MAG: hypothetical protein AB1813_26350, partial [Verrucomicrobiota bacterium]
NTVWNENARVHVTGSLTVPAGASLTIGAGSIVWLDPAVNITNSGTLEIHGTVERPVVFTPIGRVAPEQHDAAWGGIIMRGTAARLIARGTIMTGAGAARNFDFSPGASHRSEQALLLVHSGAKAFLTNCYLINQAGQIGNGYNSDITFDHCLLQRAITAGEYEGGTIVVNHSAVIEFPIESGTVSAQIADADYDGIYFTTGTHILMNSLFGFAKDDAIDSGSGGGGTVLVTNCWVESALHEGLAWSGENRVTWTYDTVVMNCGQGIECGWSTGANSPNCFAERLFTTANAVGARFGDNYDWTYNGFLRITNSLALYNYRDVWGMNWDDWTYRAAQMDIRGNALSRSHAQHPDNAVWNPSIEAPRLALYGAGSGNGVVGIGLAVWENKLSLDTLRNGIPVRLSSFSTNVVEVEFQIETPAAVIASGKLTFLPGETVKTIAATTPAALQKPLRLSLRQAKHAELTGRSELFWLPDSADGEEPVTLIPKGDTWRFWDRGTDPTTAWRLEDFPDGSWGIGPAELGNGDEADGRPEATMINIGPSGARFPTLYFRHKFNVTEPAEFELLTVNLLRDDGGIVYINEREVFRSNMPEGTISFADYAFAAIPGSDETRYFSTNVSARLLKPGLNLCAVEIHNASNTSSDVSFDLELVAHKPAPLPKLRTARFGDALVLYWRDAGMILEQAAHVTGPWTSVDAGNPMTIQLTSPGSHFFRLRGESK